LTAAGLDVLAASGAVDSGLADVMLIEGFTAAVGTALVVRLLLLTEVVVSGAAETVLLVDPVVDSRMSFSFPLSMDDTAFNISETLSSSASRSAMYSS
jgi:hypothetical protein